MSRRREHNTLFLRSQTYSGCPIETLSLTLSLGRSFSGANLSARCGLDLARQIINANTFSKAQLESNSASLGNCHCLLMREKSRFLTKDTFLHTSLGSSLLQLSVGIIGISHNLKITFNIENNIFLVICSD